MNPKKKPRTSLYSDKLHKHWSNCSAGFDDLPSWSTSCTKESFKNFKHGGWGDQWEEEEEENGDVDIIWSSSSDDEDEKVKKNMGTLDTSTNRRRVVTLEGRTGEHRKKKRRPSLGRNAPMAFQRSSKSPGNEDVNLEDSIISDSESDHDDRDLPCKSDVPPQRDKSYDRTDPGIARMKVSGVQEEPPRDEGISSVATRSLKTAMTSHFVDKGKRKYVQGKKDLFDPEILDYDSPSEEENESISDVTSSEQSWARDSPKITSTSPRPKDVGSSIMSNPMTSPKTGSDWVKKLKLQASITPDRKLGRSGDGEAKGGRGSSSGPGLMDSARKKKKFVSCGLAERLQKLVSREKSSIAMWYHNRTDSQHSQDNTKSRFVVKVLSCDPHRGLYLTHCVTQVSCRSKVNDELRPKGEGDESLGEEVYVFFTRSTGDQLGLAAGMLISINTPWQKLSIPHVSKPVVLCTYYCRPLNLDPDNGVQDQAVVTGYPTENSKSPKVLTPMRLFPGVSSNRSPGAEVAIGQENRTKNISASIMQSVSESGTCSSSGVSFKARVQRIVTRRLQAGVPYQSARISGRGSHHTQSSPSLIKSLLLQDREGVVCEVQLTNQIAESSTWQQVLQSGEGRSYIFMNLRVAQRLTLSRAPGLSSMIRMLQHHPNQINGQSVCYVLTSEIGMTEVESLDDCDSMDLPLFRPPNVMDISDAIKNAKCPWKRTSFLTTPLLLTSTNSPSLHPKDSSNKSSGSWFLFLSTYTGQHQQHSSIQGEEISNGHNRSDQDQYVCLHVHQSHVLNQEVQARCASSGNRKLLCRDVHIASTEQGVQLNADGFSQISVVDESDNESVSSLSLSSLKVDTRLHSLVSVTGNICGVEEESACSWPSCPLCGNNHLDGGEGSGFMLHCLECNKDVSSPVIRMHLVVLLTCPNLPTTHAIKVKLLQPTIESVLPSSSQTSGGHDLQSILGVLVGPINCLVNSVNELPQRKEYRLEEVLLCN
ncbi:DNA repair-scaffolding protein-like [Lytechinus variegatus]|uniref:DNA repair-scaffolding protein-like n=1 Tax=Lytechinus variegatus TaxID=7654 RepID=UPI001BB29E69|nr:DNA repair-scaffolding protein-like [Lytechinus variegatus]